MSALRDFQTRFGEYLNGGKALDASTFANAGLARNASIHRNNVNHAHSGALAANFPAVRNLLGEQCFDALAALYCVSIAPESAVLAEYGAALPNFIESRAEFAQLPYLPDVAQLEWAANLCLSSACDQPLTQAGLALLAQSDANVHLAPVSSLQLLATPYPAQAIRRAAIDGDAVRLSRIEPAPQWLAIFRSFGGVQVKTLSSGEFSLLSSLGRSICLSTAIADAVAVDPALQPPETIGRFLQLGLLAAASTHGRNPKHEHHHKN